MLVTVCGPMFSGKTTELIRRIQCSEVAKQRTIVLTPSIDTRSGSKILSHAGVCLEARACDTESPLDLDPNLDVIGIDEAQFLGRVWLDAISAMVDQGQEVVCACLNQDYKGRPFGIAADLIAMADHIVHLKAVCVDCGRKDRATKTFRFVGGDEQIEVGGSEKYVALCRACWVQRSKG